MCKLAFAAGLARVARVHRSGLGDGLLVRDLRSADIRLDAELAQKAIDDDLQMELTHAGDDGLARFLVRVGLEGGVFLASLPRAMSIFSCPALVLGSIATRMTGSGNSIDSSTIGYFSSQSVSPVVVFLRPTAAAMSPE